MRSPAPPLFPRFFPPFAEIGSAGTAADGEICAVCWGACVRIRDKWDPTHLRHDTEPHDSNPHLGTVKVVSDRLSRIRTTSVDSGW